MEHNRWFKSAVASTSQKTPEAGAFSIASDLSVRLVDWYLENYRKLPWRETRDPYRIWISEVMLQQTQVTTVLSYYKRFLERYPDVKSLAEAPLEDVLKVWEGLGYYARCRNLHKAAQVIMADYKGRFPDNFEDVNRLPGIGRSTAGAIMTFGFDEPYPLLDGNVKRVLSRLFNIDDEINKPVVEKRLWEYSKLWLNDAVTQTGKPYHFNQAVMELGATMCLPKQPMCLVCPVEHCCKAKAMGTQHELPVKARKKPTPHYTIGAGVIWKEGQVLIQRRPEKGLLGGLWEFPGGKQEDSESLQETVSREIMEELGLAVVVKDKIIVVKHAYTHFKITLHAFHCHWVSGVPEAKSADAWQWVVPEKLEAFAFPRANKKVLEQLRLELDSGTIL